MENIISFNKDFEKIKEIIKLLGDHKVDFHKESNTWLVVYASLESNREHKTIKINQYYNDLIEVVKNAMRKKTEILYKNKEKIWNELINMKILTKKMLKKIQKGDDNVLRKVLRNLIAHALIQDSKFEKYVEYINFILNQGATVGEQEKKRLKTIQEWARSKGMLAVNYPGL